MSTSAYHRALNSDAEVVQSRRKEQSELGRSGVGPLEYQSNGHAYNNGAQAVLSAASKDRNKVTRKRRSQGWSLQKGEELDSKSDSFFLIFILNGLNSLATKKIYFLILTLHTQ